MWFGTSFECKWGLCANTCYVNVFLKGPQHRVCLCCVWNEDHQQEGRELFTSQENSPPSHVPSWSVVFWPHLIFLTSRPFFLFSCTASLWWLCGSGYPAKEATQRSCVRRQKGGRCFLTLLRLTWAAGKGTTAQRRLSPAHIQANNAVAPLFLSCSVFFRSGVRVSRTRRNQRGGRAECETSAGSVLVSSLNLP